jgi:TonB family protein
MNHLILLVGLLSLFAACGHHNDQVRYDDAESSVCVNAEDRRKCLVERVGRLSGRTVIRAVIEADGTISNSNVVESSGNSIIDQLALEDVRKASPVKNPFRKRIVTMIPVEYRPSNRGDHRELNPLP